VISEKGKHLLEELKANQSTSIIYEVLGDLDIIALGFFRTKEELAKFIENLHKKSNSKKNSHTISHEKA